jgi:hypothetical protein
MLKLLLSSVLAFAAVSACAAELHFDLSQTTAGQCPAGFVSLVTGGGKRGEWKVIEEQVPPVIAPLTDNARSAIAQRPVLAQVSQDASAGRAPVLLYTNEMFGDFTMATRFKIVGGAVEPAAGLIFRAQDQSNYYVLRASALGNLLWYKVIGGIAYESVGIGVRLPIRTGDWHDLTVECTGSGIRCFLDGKLAIPPAKAGSPTNDLAINDTSFSTGEIGFWTKADSVAWFVDTRIDYKPRVPFMQVIADATVKKYPRLLGLKIFGNRIASLPVIIADPIGKGLGAAGTKVEADVIARGTVYFLKHRGDVEVTLPLRDRNGEVVAALRTTMKSFKGETQDTALARALIVKKDLEERLATLQDINQ